MSFFQAPEYTNDKHPTTAVHPGGKISVMSQHHGSWLKGKGVYVRLVTLLVVVLQVWRNLSRRSKNVPRLYTLEIPTAPPKTTRPVVRFTPGWVMQYAAGDEGCDLARGSYIWRGHGLGSNINSKRSSTM